MLFQENLRQLRVVPAGLIAFVAAAMAVLPLSGAETPAAADENENVASERPDRWFSAHWLLDGPVRLAAPKTSPDCVAKGAAAVQVGLADAEVMLDEGCPEYVALDDFREVEYPDGIGITMCKLDGVEVDTNEYGASISGGYKDYVSVSGGGRRSTTRTMCHYYGCNLRVSEAAANWSTRN